MKAAFRVDASTEIGTGHLTRCLALANHLRQEGADTRFLCRAPSQMLSEQIRGLGHALDTLPAPRTTSALPPDLPHAHWLGASQEEDAQQSAELLGRVYNLLVIDHYGIDYRWQRRMRASVETIMMIDDLADRRHDCDLLLDQNVYADDRARYSGLISPHCETLLGPHYALLRPDFALPLERPAHADQRLNIFMGGADSTGATLMALKAVTPLCNGALQVDVIAGGANPYLPEIRAACAAVPTVTLHVQSRSMAALFAGADLGIGAGGSAALERCSRGLPQILVSLAQNQRETCKAFARAQVAVNLGDVDQLRPRTLQESVVSLLAEPARLALMSDLGRAMVDGKGTDRVAARLMQR